MRTRKRIDKDHVYLKFQPANMADQRQAKAQSRQGKLTKRQKIQVNRRGNTLILKGRTNQGKINAARRKKHDQ